MTQRRLKIGIMSFAHGHAIGFLRTLQGLGVDIAAADPDSERADEVQRRYGIQVFDNYDELLAWCPDGVAIGSENVYHRELTEKAAAAGAYVLCEKPLATTLADCRAMIVACETANVGLMTAFPMRFAPPIAAVAATVHDGRIGAVQAISGRNPGTAPGGWFSQPELSGGGSVIDHTVHVADLMAWFTGAEPATVYAQTNALIRPDLGVETGGLISVQFTDGTIATIDASWSRLPTYPAGGAVTIEVVGTDGVLHADAYATHVSLHGATTHQLMYGMEHSQRMLAEFVASITEGRAPSPDGHDGMRATAIALAAYESARTNDVVSVYPTED